MGKIPHFESDLVGFFSAGDPSQNLTRRVRRVPQVAVNFFAGTLHAVAVFNFWRFVA
jgi:hypothetical protein